MLKFQFRLRLSGESRAKPAETNSGGAQCELIPQIRYRFLSSLLELVGTDPDPQP